MAILVSTMAVQSPGPGDELFLIFCQNPEEEKVNFIIVISSLFLIFSSPKLYLHSQITNKIPEKWKI